MNNNNPYQITDLSEGFSPDELRDFNVGEEVKEINLDSLSGDIELLSREELEFISLDIPPE